MSAPQFTKLVPGYWATPDFSQAIRQEGDRFFLFDDDGERANVGSLERAMEVASWPIAEDATGQAR